MTDLVGRKIRIGDYCYKFKVGRGSFWSVASIVIDFTPKMVKFTNSITYNNDLRIELTTPGRILVCNDIPNKNKYIIDLANEFDIPINEDQLPIEKS